MALPARAPVLVDRDSSREVSRVMEFEAVVTPM